MTVLLATVAPAVPIADSKWVLLESFSQDLMIPIISYRFLHAFVCEKPAAKVSCSKHVIMFTVGCSNVVIVGQLLSDQIAIL